MKIMSSSLRTNAALNAVRKIFSIIFPLVTFSYASHILGPERVGIYAFSQSIVNYFLLIASLGISTYAVREGQRYRENRTNLEKFTSEVFSINIIMTIVSYILLIALCIVWRRLDDYRVAISILSTTIILTTIGADWVNTLFEDYLYITVRYIIVQSVCLILLFVFGNFQDNLYQYIIICTLSMAGGNLLNIWYVRKQINIRFIFNMNFMKHIKPMLILFSNNLSIQIYLISDITLLGFFLTDDLVGIYSISSRIYTTLKEVVNAMILVTVPRFSYYLRNKKEKEYHDTCAITFNTIITVLAPIMTGLFFESGIILSLLAGEKYLSGTLSLQILSFAMIFAVGGCFFSYSVLIPYGQEKYFLTATVIAAIFNVLFNCILIPAFGMNMAAVTTLFSECIVCIFTYYHSRQYQKLKFDKSVIFPVVIGIVQISVICTVLKYFFSNPYLYLGISVISCTVIYTILQIIFKNPVAVECYRLAKDKIKF